MITLSHSMPTGRGNGEDVRTRLAVARRLKAERYATALADQVARTEIVDGYALRPAIGHTGGAVNLGWELLPPAGGGPAWYLRDRDMAESLINAHHRAYA